MADYQMVMDVTACEEYKQTIKVKIYKRWESFDGNGLPGMSFILIDEDGSKIAASVDNLQLSYIERVFLEGAWVEVSKFGVINSNWEERMTRHAFQIILNNQTKASTIRPLTEDPFIKLTDFSHVYNKPYTHYYPIDLLGVLDKPIGNIVTAVHPDGTMVPTIYFRIRDLEDYTLDCVPRGVLAYDIKEKCDCKFMKGQYAICVLTDWVVHRNMNGMTIYDYDGGRLSRFIVAPPIDEVFRFRLDLWNKRRTAENTSGNSDVMD
ncbi:uncharacterized protein LOC112088436 [Eutrema salsugineum]|uniref:uncharacterized protein LOC112088436 n=1 Tax=Eutrema salsugineum TaxID=72664 RepID=UPI000CED0BBB|nr:uncharacterized protein LOC112088436 [Eutrema salsugineum]